MRIIASLGQLRNEMNASDNLKAIKSIMSRDTTFT